MSNETIKTEDRIKAFLERYKNKTQKQEPINEVNIKINENELINEAQNEFIVNGNHTKNLFLPTKTNNLDLNNHETHDEADKSLKENKTSSIIQNPVPLNFYESMPNIYSIDKFSRLPLSVNFTSVNGKSELSHKITNNKSSHSPLLNRSKPNNGIPSNIQSPINHRELLTPLSNKTLSILRKQSPDKLEQNVIGNSLVNKEAAKKRFMDKLNHFSQQSLLKKDKPANNNKDPHSNLRLKQQQETIKKSRNNYNNGNLIRGESCNLLRSSVTSQSPQRSRTPTKKSLRKIVDLDKESRNKTPIQAMRKTTPKKTIIMSEENISEMSTYRIVGKPVSERSIDGIQKANNNNNNNNNKINEDDNVNNKKIMVLFPESSQKLEYLNNIIDDKHKFKKEIKNLIQVIKNEKEQITSDLEKMSQELIKYKTAYKKLKKKLKGIDTEGDLLDDQLTNNPSFDSKNVSKTESKNDDKNILNSSDINVNHRLSVPLEFKINNEPELASQINFINQDIDNLTSCSFYKQEKISTASSENSKNTITKDYVTLWIIREMGIDPKLFFDDARIEDEMFNRTPRFTEQIQAQKNIIWFLIKKLKLEEKQRLATEDQTTKMALSMEKTILQLEERLKHYENPIKKNDNLGSNESL